MAEAERNPGYPQYGGFFARSFTASHAFTDEGWGDGMADAISRTGHRGPGSYKPHPKEMPRRSGPTHPPRCRVGRDVDPYEISAMKPHDHLACA